MPPNNKKAFFEVMQHFAEQSKSKRLFKKAESLYLMRSYKISNISYQEAQQSYERLQAKYQSGQLTANPNDWHKNERKLFIWYLICFSEQKKVSIQDLTSKEWDHMSEMFFGKNSLFLQFQGLSIIKNTKRHVWTTQDDQLLKKYVKQINSNEWNAISKSIFFENPGKFISAKQCRQRWFNHINQEINKKKWTHQQDIQIIKLSIQIGKKWSQIAKMLNTNRTQHMVKNRYNSIINKMRRKKVQNEESLTRKALVFLQKQINQQKKDKSSQFNHLQLEKEQSQSQSQSQQIAQENNSQKNKQEEKQKIKKEQQKNNEIQIKQEQQQLTLKNLPQGCIKDISTYAKGSNNLIKGTFVFNDEYQQIDNNQINDKGVICSSTPTHSIFAPSPGFHSSFFTFQNYQKKNKEEGNPLPSPAPQFFPNMITSQSPTFDQMLLFKDEKNIINNLNISREIMGTPIIRTPAAHDNPQNYKTYASQWNFNPQPK